jgi:hypothetical protein
MSDWFGSFFYSGSWGWDVHCWNLCDFRRWINGEGRRFAFPLALGTPRQSAAPPLRPLARAVCVRGASLRHRGIPRGSAR